MIPEIQQSHLRHGPHDAVIHYGTMNSQLSPPNQRSILKELERTKPSQQMNPPSPARWDVSPIDVSERVYSGFQPAGRVSVSLNGISAKVILRNLRSKNGARQFIQASRKRHVGRKP